MSGPLAGLVPAPADAGGRAHGPTTEVVAARESTVGRFRVRRALPRRARRTVGAWCFADHLGPEQVNPEAGLDVGPHPHIGLATLTWLFAGQVRHRDSLGTEQVIAPGQLNLMTAGAGVVHSEEAAAGYTGPLHGMQLWVAQPETTRHGAPAFEHHRDPPRVRLGDARATVIVGELAGTRSPARADTALVGAEIAFADGGASTPALRRDFEYALVVAEGTVTVGDGVQVGPGRLAYLGDGLDELGMAASGPARLLLLGGVPFDEPVLMWWNFVARDRGELTAAYAAWRDGTDRFARLDSPLDPLVAPVPPWTPTG